MSVTIIAEVGQVHDGSLGNAKKLVALVSDLGADAIKYQTHIASAEMLPDAPAPPYFSEEARATYFERTAFGAQEWLQIRKDCDDRSVMFLSSPFSEEAVDLLEEVGVAAYKVPSGETSNLPLVRKVASTGKPVFLSTGKPVFLSTGKPVFLSSGMSDWAELAGAVNAVLRLNPQLTVLQCTSEYPCPAEHVGINVMLAMRKRYGVQVGLSDHTMTNYAAFAAVSLGASVVEKHLTFSRHMYGSDAGHSVEPNEFAELVRGIRWIETMLTNAVDKDDLRGYDVMRRVFQKSLVTTVEIPAGQRIERNMIAIKKPGGGIAPDRLERVIGAEAVRTIPPDRVLTDEDVLLVRGDPASHRDR